MRPNWRAFCVTTFLVSLSVMGCLVLVETSAYLLIKRGGSGYYEADSRNSLGLRDFREPDDLKRETVILMLGDSFTYGFGVKSEESYPAQLEERLRSAGLDVAVVNAGKPGFDTQMAFDRLQAIYRNYQPTCVVLGFHSADLIQNSISYKKLLERPSKSDSRLVDEGGVQEAIQQAEASLPWIYLVKEYTRRSSSTGALMDYLYKNHLIKYLPPPTRIRNLGDGTDFEATEYFLDQIVDFLSGTNTQFILLGIVPLVRFDAYPYGRLNERLATYASSRNIVFVDPLAEFSNSGYRSGSLWVSMKDAHYNAEGNRIISEKMQRVLVGQDGGTCALPPASRR